MSGNNYGTLVYTDREIQSFVPAVGEIPVKVCPRVGEFLTKICLRVGDVPVLSRAPKWKVDGWGMTSALLYTLSAWLGLQ